MIKKNKAVNKNSKIKKIIKNHENKKVAHKTKLNLIGKNNTNSPKKYIPGKKMVIIWSEFNTMPFSNKRFSESWIEKRIDIFMKFTLNSLKSQTNQNYLALIKYEDKSKDIITKVLSRYPKLPNNVTFIAKSKYEKKVIEKAKGFDYLYLVRLDSDDMYHKSFIQQLFDYKHHISTEAIINQNGYIYDSIKKQIAKFPQISPNYYTLIYKVDDYISGKRYKIPGGHPNVIKLLNHEILKKPNYIRLVHSTNDSSTFRLANRKYIISDKDRMNKILNDFM